MNKFRRSKRVLLLVLVLSATVLFIQPAAADPPYLFNRTDKLSDSYPGDTATNVIGFQIGYTTAMLGSIEIQFCSNSPLIAEPCTSPVGFDASGALLSNQIGNTGFSISNLSSTNAIILTRTPVAGNNDNNTYQLDNIVNPTTLGTYYVRLTIYPTTDASGAYTIAGGIALSTISRLTINSIVPPYLLFCSAIVIVDHNCADATGNYVNLGSFNQNQTSSGISEFTVATNAQYGFSVTIDGDTLRSGINPIPALSSPTVSLIGDSQFGLNLQTNSVPPVGADPFGADATGTIASNYDVPNQFMFNSGNVVLASVAPSGFETYTVSYIANVNSNQPPGFYVTTISFICLANF
ncbi:MAG TPA: hypothetical protein VMR08_01510 [Patescibacteria group bacterium]|jgi:hypothetical protein|nr:hypothetical protein [Patescibacteria group bacterium]